MKILYSIGLSLLLIVVYCILAFLQFENFTIFLIVVFFMLFNQLLAYLLVGTNPKEGMNRVGAIFTLLVATQLFSIVFLGAYLSIGAIGYKIHFHLDDILYSALFFALALPAFMTFLIWYFDVRLQKPKF